jgi:hypothetical protein
MTKIKSDPRVHTRAVPDPAPIEEMPVAKKTAPKAASDRKPPGPKRRKA